jgi:cellulose synthase/poly-beta-1,6-N-acetylglucosamine synthase-like glycosyltransferase
MIILSILYWILVAFLAFYSAYYFLTVTIGMLPAKTEQKPHDFNPNVLIVLPAYQPSPIFLDVIASVERSRPKYSSVYVLFQEADQDLVDSVKANYPWMRIEEKNFSHLGGNAYQHALRHINTYVSKWSKTSNDYVVLIDKDNIIEDNFFTKMKEHADHSMDLIQGKRSALSLKGDFSIFDAASEILNDTMLRSAKMKLGLPIEVSGSGALIRAEVFQRAIDGLDPKAPGFDKNFMVNLITMGRLNYLYVPEAIIREEKTAYPDDYKMQRIRWFGEQYYNALFHGKRLLQTASWASLDYLVTLFRPPRSVMMFLLMICSFCEALAWLSGHQIIPYFSIFSILVLSSSLYLFSRVGLLILMIKASRHLPKLVVNNVWSVFNSLKRKYLGTFIPTSHRL